MDSQSTTPSRHAEFEISYIWVSLASAILAGFSIGAHMVFVLGFGLPVGPGFNSFTQVHGHVQLVGWAGLFIMGVSLHFLPRASGIPISRPAWIKVPWVLIGTGLTLRILEHCALPYVAGKPAFARTSWLVFTSGIIEWTGIMIYLKLLCSSVGKKEAISSRPGLRSVLPYFVMMSAGWFLFATMNAVLLLQMVISKAVVVNQAWDEFANQIFLGMVLLPVAFAFSVRTFPLYLRLPAPDWPIAGFGLFYLVSLLLQILPTLPLVADSSSPLLIHLSALGRTLKAVGILWFVWKLDVLTRRRQPWTVNRIGEPGPDRRPTRPGLPDFGEFGGFERLVYSAYAALSLAAAIETAFGVSVLLGHPLSVSIYAIRHLYLLGFITLLILGMAPRMIPGFLHKKQVASPRLVDVSFWLGIVTVVSREFLLLLPESLIRSSPPLEDFARAALGLSGLFGMVALSCLAANLWLTARQPPDNHPSPP